MATGAVVAALLAVSGALGARATHHADGWLASIDLPQRTVPADVWRGPVPTAQQRAKLLVIGDSEAAGLYPYLRQRLGSVDVVKLQQFTKVSSGLSRPDFFDWPHQLAWLLPQVRPDLVVVMLGGNDGQALLDTHGAVVSHLDPADPGHWRDEYGGRVTALLDQLQAGGAFVIWVGIPNSPDPGFNGRIQVQDEAVRAATGGRRGVAFVDVWHRFATRRGTWTARIIDPADGTRKLVRAADGFHLNPAGATILAGDVAAVVIAELRRRGADVPAG